VLVFFYLVHFDLPNVSERGRAWNINLLLLRDWNLILVNPHSDRDSNSYRCFVDTYQWQDSCVFLMHACRTESGTHG
jgi:hypothetical protein